MIRKDIDNFLSPKFRIVQRLALIGVAVDSFEELQPRLIRYIKDNYSRIPEIVSVVLPSDEDTMEAVLESQSDSPKPQGTSNLKDQFQESMVLLQWLMFMDEPGSALKNLTTISSGQRGLCGAVWGENDIAYRCRTCEHDPTCAICVPCFSNGTHKDHDYSIIYMGRGCCDCGDVTAWKREGFCSKHKGTEQIQPLPEEFADSVGPVLDSLFLVWRKKLGYVESLSKESSGIAGLKKFANVMTSVVVDMLLDFCNHSESLLSFVSGRVLSSVGLLDVLVRAERFLDKDTRKLQELFLKLFCEPQFKYEFAKVFLKYYPSLVNDAIKENNDSHLKRYPLISTFSVQIFTVPTLTPRLVKEMNLLTMLFDCVRNIFCFCAEEDGRLQVYKWGNLHETTIRVFEDIRLVMSHSVVPKYVSCERRDILRTWMKLLGSVQGMDPQKRETGIHIEEENENINLPFVLVHSIANIHHLLVAGAFSSINYDETEYEAFANEQDFEEQDSLRHAKVGRISQESSISGALDCALRVADVKPKISPIPNSVSSLIFECLRSIENVLGVDNSSGILSVVTPETGNIHALFALKRTRSKIRKGRYIFKTYDEAATENHGQQGSSSPSNNSAIEGEPITEFEALRVLSLSDWPNITYDVSSQVISVHMPLHCLLSSVLQRALKQCYDGSISSNPLTAISGDFFGRILGGCHPYGFSNFVMEHPLRIRAFCAQVHAGMWRKNGDYPVISCKWYHSVRWNSLAPNYALSALHKELKSSSGFILSLLLQIVQNMGTKNALTLLLRLRGIQLFAESVCSGVSVDECPSCTSGQGGNMLCILENADMEVRYPDIQFWSMASDPVLARDAFSSLMWILFCLPSPFLSCEESFLSLVHIFYVVSIIQAIITHCAKCEFSTSELSSHGSLITDIMKFVNRFGFAQQYFVSSYTDPSCDITDTIRRLTFPYLRRCALLWNLINSSTSTPYSSDGPQLLDRSFRDLDDQMDYVGGHCEDLVEIEKLEKMFKLPLLDNVLNDELFRSIDDFASSLPGSFAEIKQNCPDCGVVQEEAALCLLCGKLCSPNWKPCCRKNGCQTHAMACGAGTGVFLLIRRTTILLQRSARQAPWPSPYLDAYGEEDMEMHKRKAIASRRRTLCSFNSYGSADLISMSYGAV